MSFGRNKPKVYKPNRICQSDLKNILRFVEKVTCFVIAKLKTGKTNLCIIGVCFCVKYNYLINAKTFLFIIPGRKSCGENNKNTKVNGRALKQINKNYNAPNNLT